MFQNKSKSFSLSTEPSDCWPSQPSSYDSCAILDEVGVLLESDIEPFCFDLEPTPIPSDRRHLNVVPEIPVHGDTKLLKSGISPDFIQIFASLPTSTNKRSHDSTMLRPAGGDSCTRDGDHEIYTNHVPFSSTFLEQEISADSFFSRTEDGNKNKRIRRMHLSSSEKDEIQQQEDYNTCTSILEVSDDGISNIFYDCCARQQRLNFSEQDEESPVSPLSHAGILTDKNNNNNAFQARQWNLRCQELLDFKKASGHCCVPNSFPPNPQLAQWVKRQRYQYKLKQEGKHTTVTDEREQILNDIGFVWDSHSAAWNERFNELVAFYILQGHCNVPANYSENRQLSIWVKCQRRQYRLQKSAGTAGSCGRSYMTAERIAKLESINFTWNPRGL